MDPKEIRKRNIAAGFTPPEGLREGVEARAYSFRPKTFDAENLTVEATLATENPARVWDWERYEVVTEVLLMDGLKKVPNQVPLLDSHNRDRVSDQLGSTVPIKEDGGKLGGVRRFSKANPQAVVAAGMVDEGHLTDGSIGYQVEKSSWVEAGETKSVKGREFTGPLKVGTRWTLLEDSVTPIGADKAAKVRSGGEDFSGFEASASDMARSLEERKMLEQLRKQFEAMGLKADASDEDVLAFAASLATKEEPKPPATPDLSEVEKRVAQAERKRITEIRDLALLVGDKDLGQELIDEGKGIEEARTALMERAKSSGKLGGTPIGAPAAPEGETLDLSKIDSDTLARSLCDPALF